MTNRRREHPVAGQHIPHLPPEDRPPRSRSAMRCPGGARAGTPPHASVDPRRGHHVELARRSAVATISARPLRRRRCRRHRPARKCRPPRRRTSAAPPGPCPATARSRPLPPPPSPPPRWHRSSCCHRRARCCRGSPAGNRATTRSIAAASLRQGIRTATDCAAASARAWNPFAPARKRLSASAKMGPIRPVSPLSLLQFAAPANATFRWLRQPRARLPIWLPRRAEVDRLVLWSGILAASIRFLLLHAAIAPHRRPPSRALSPRPALPRMATAGGPGGTRASISESATAWAHGALSRPALVSPRLSVAGRALRVARPGGPVPAPGPRLLHRFAAAARATAQAGSLAARATPRRSAC